MVYKTTELENYSKVIENEFETYTVPFDEIIDFVKQNREKKLDLTIPMEDFLKTRNTFSKILENLSELGMPEKSLILRLPLGLTRFDDEKLSGKYPFSKFKNLLKVKLSFIYKIVLPPTFNQAIHFEKNGIPLVVPSALNYVVAQDFSTGEPVWNDGNNGYETYTVEQKYLELNEYAFVFDNIAVSYESEPNSALTDISVTAAPCEFESMLTYSPTAHFAPSAEKSELSGHVFQGRIRKRVKNRESKICKRNAVTANTVQDSMKIEAAVFAPPAVTVNIPFIIYVAIFHHKDFDEIKADFTCCSDKPEFKGNKTIKLKISKKAQIDIKLTLKKTKTRETVFEETHSQKWENITIKEDFEIVIPKTYVHNSILGEVEILVNGEPSCKFLFNFAVGTLLKEGFKILQSFLNSPTGKVLIAVVVNSMTGMNVTELLK